MCFLRENVTLLNYFVEENEEPKIIIIILFSLSLHFYGIKEHYKVDLYMILTYFNIVLKHLVDHLY